MNGRDGARMRRLLQRFASINPGSTLSCSITRNQHEMPFAAVKPARRG